jgi:uncharacterized protein
MKAAFWRQKWNQWRDAVRLFSANPAVQFYGTALTYLSLITLAELITTYYDPLLGVIVHSGILVALLYQGSVSAKNTNRRFLILMSLAPLTRILSLSIPLPSLGLPIIYWYMIIGALLLVAALIAGRITDMSWRRIGWSWKSWPTQTGIGAIGIGLGLMEYWILKPGPLATTMNLIDILVSAFIFLVFTGFLEEVIFRGLLQSATMQAVGKSGLVYVAVVFTVLHIGYKSLPDLLFVLGVGLLFGWLVWKTHSLWGASLAHGLANFSLYVIFPFLLGSQSMPASSSGELAMQTQTPVVSQMVMDATISANLLLPPADVLLDNGAPGFLISGKNIWPDSRTGYQGSYLWTYAAQFIPDVVVTWFPSFTGCGKYEVEAFIPEGTGLTEAARYSVQSRQDIKIIPISQAFFQGRWAPLGVFEFDAGISSYIQLSNLSGEDPKLRRWIAFDAIRWVLIGACS